MARRKYAAKYRAQVNGRFRPTSPFVRPDHEDAAPLLEGMSLERAQGRDAEELTRLLTTPGALYAQRRPRR